MPAPNIEMIADSLRNCSLNARGRGRGRGVPSPPTRSPAVRGPPPAQQQQVMVELNSEVALPYHWEQCLDMRTGQVYYRNWMTGQRTTVDPRYNNNAYYSSSSSEDSSDDEDDSSNEGNKDNYFNSDVSTAGDSSSSSAYSPEVSSPPVQVLVAAGCKSCFMYLMVPKTDLACPKCGRLLLHLGRNG